MIHKLGINKDNEIKDFFFKKLQITLDINASHKDIYIISVAVNSKVEAMKIDTSIDNRKTLISLEVTLSYKVLYGLANENSVFVLKEESFHIVEFFKENYINGYSLEELNLDKSIGCKIKVNHMDIDLNLDKLTISSYIICNLFYKKQYSLAFVSFNNEGDNNIFLASSDAKKILQKTFTKDIVYKDISFIKNTKEICYLSNEENKFNLYILEIKNLVSKKVFTDIYIDEVINYTLINGHNLIFLANTTEGLSLCQGNLRNGSFNRLINIVSKANNTKLLVNKLTKEIYYFETLKSKGTLYELRNNGFKVQLLCIEGQVLYCDINNNFNYIVGIRNLNSILELFIYDKQNINYVKLPDGVKSIKKLVIANNSSLIFMLCIYDNETSLLIYDVDNRKFKNIPSKLNVATLEDFALAPCEEEIFFTAKSNKSLNIYRLSLKTLENEFLISTSNQDLQLYYKN